MAQMNSFTETVNSKGDWQVFTQQQGYSDVIFVWLGQYRDGRYYNATVGKDGHLELAEVKEGAIDPKPLLKIPRRLWQMIVDDVSTNTKPTIKAEVDAELKATKYHLEDVRSLLKLK